MSMETREKIEELLRGVFSELHEHNEPEYAKKRDDFVFHMTDWLDDLDDLRAIYNAEETTKEVAARFIVSFIYHVAPHLNAAGRLLLDEVPDPFLKAARNDGD
jgi:hypothetical protein